MVLAGSGLESGLLLLSILALLTASVAYFWEIYFKEGQRIGVIALRIGWLALAATLAVRMVETQSLPLFSLYDGLLVFVFLLTLVHALIEEHWHPSLFGLFIAPFGFLTLLYAGSLQVPPEHLFLATGNWLTLHVILAILGYTAFALACALAVVYLVQEYHLRHSLSKRLYRRLPALDTLDRLGHRLVVLGFPLLTLTLLTGSVWASYTWGQFWSWEAKEIWTAFIWLIYAVYLAGRRWGRWHGHRAALMVLIGFASVLVNLVLVNQVFSDLHVF